MNDLKALVQSALNNFSTGNLKQNASALLKVLGYASDRTFQLFPNNYQGFWEYFGNQPVNFDLVKARTKEWQTIDIISQLVEDDIKKTQSLFGAKQVDNTIIESYLFFALSLTGDTYTRGDLVRITREVNKLTPMPAMILFKYANYLTIAVIDRRLHKREGSKDVLEKVTLIKDINISQPHRAHIEILFDLSLNNLVKEYSVSNFVELHNAWRKTLDTTELNKKFYRELANWYFWAIQNVSFPDDAEKNRDILNATSVIRLITRLIFVWFLKEKSLIPDDLFNQSKLKQILNYQDKNNTTYYKAILQNLFFATLNTEMNTKDKLDSRKFRGKRKNGRDQHYMIHNVFRYADFFINPEESLRKYFENIPFLNGGLFECLDKVATINGKDNIVRIDGFSDHPMNVLKVPDSLFFSTEKEIDLNETYGTKNKTYKVRGLIDILNSYKFTVDENTPIEEEVALDPELLGKVFENLLASYNPETGSTARKQTGSFYTPREIVNYMVDESLIAYLSTVIDNAPSAPPLKLRGGRGELLEVGAGNNTDLRLRHLLSYTDDPHQFTPSEVDKLINAIDNAKILDPACGSGAFPMGILHKLVYILRKLDPHNQKWKQRQIEKVMEVPDATVREKLIEDIEQSFQNNELDYGRKLYLIENSIFGVDIQPIAVQIAKLRFFISLIVDQKINYGMDNLGIRPLPNLETKFVAANTLLGIEKPAQGILRNPEIDRKEDELKKVRERHFTARTPYTKEKYRKEDERLRDEIAELLKNDGFPRETTEKLAAWNPYDQNASADFFDPEWMFGIKSPSPPAGEGKGEGGFDVVIGNPPYRQLSKDISAKSDYRNYLKVRFKTSGGRLNTFIFFIHEGIELLSRWGNLIYIIPNTFLTQEYYKETRKLLRDTLNISQIVHYPTMQFENAVVENITIQVKKSAASEKTKYYIQESDKIHQHTEFDLKLKSLPPNFSFNISDNVILGKIEETESVKLNDLCEINQAIALIGDKSLSLRNSNPNGTFYRLIDGRNIGKYSIKWGGVYLDYNLDRIHSCKRKDIFEASEKLFFRRVSSSLIFTYDNEQYYALKTLVVLNKKKSTADIKFLLGLLNSKLMNFYYKEKFKSTKKVFSEIQARSVGNLLIKEISSKAQQPFITLVDQILAAKQKDPHADTSASEKQIDNMVYQLYGLTPEEIAVVEGLK